MKTEHTQEEYNIRDGAQEFPLMCVTGLSYVCNAKCPNCPYTRSTIRSTYEDRPFMHESTFKILADQCGEHGAWIRLTGAGEPLLHPNAINCIAYAKKVGAKVGLITNASLLTEEKARRLLEVDIDMIECSVDADNPELYRRVRAGLDWDTVVNNIKTAVAIREEIGSKTKIIVSAIKQEGVDEKAVKKFWGPIVDEVQLRKYLTWDIVEDKSSDKTPYLPSEDKVPCPHLFERLLIDSRGRVILCAYDIIGRTDLGNIHFKSIKDIWLGKEFNYYREMHLKRKMEDLELCRVCPDWQYRSWKHNYWKIVDNAEKKRTKKVNK